VRFQFNVVFIKVGKEIIRSKYLCNLYELVVVVVAMEEGFLTEDLREKKKMVSILLP
jgi:hypothetical protein